MLTNAYNHFNLKEVVKKPKTTWYQLHFKILNFKYFTPLTIKFLALVLSSHLSIIKTVAFEHSASFRKQQHVF